MRGAQKRVRYTQEFGCKLSKEKPPKERETKVYDGLLKGGRIVL